MSEVAYTARSETDRETATTTTRVERERDSANLKLPWIKRRVFFLFVAFAFCAAGAGVGLNAIIKLNNQVDAQGRLVSTTDMGVTIDINNVYVTGMLSVVACFGIVVTTAGFIAYTVWPRRSYGQYIMSQAVFLMAWTGWLFITLVAETAFYNTGRPRVVISGDVGTLRIDDLRAAYRPIKYLRNSIILLWFSWLAVFVCTSALFIAASQVKMSRSPGPKKYGLTAEELAALPKRDPGHRHDPDGLVPRKEKVPRPPPSALSGKDSSPVMSDTADVEKAPAAAEVVQ
ncbi:hypothetical protein JR316_0011887 [Psilocybe cubensis]|uniref:Uncharacterized protein n=2 Tax=Psilocybe cubensis TaxID=181762 RepID=A0A8H7XNA1_PSICU|nr:hypothetical protein JR316_0011887 [Psilocybe cubensis]KAH9476312.1 hypothetical protein JR316_0011887 [Psilocybe cubensis]